MFLLCSCLCFAFRKDEPWLTVRIAFGIDVRPEAKHEVLRTFWRYGVVGILDKFGPSHALK